jgi:outer membrane protein OmpA-like peptidoglycan-associated protein
MNPRLPRPPLTRLALASAATCLALLAACSSMPAQNAALTQARTRLDAAQSRPEIVAMAPDDLARAREALRRADQALINGDSVDRVNHLSYLAQQQVAIAEETAAGRNAQAVITGAAAERDRMRLELRTREADMAQAQKATAEQASAAKTVQLAQSEANTQAERDRVARRDVKVGELEAQLQDMNARYTDRGVVITLGDLLFDTGASDLRAESQHRMDQLAGFMKRYPERHASIEGYTDNVGKAASNQSLSDRRASAVMAALIQLGVPGKQLSTQAFGEEHPVASNNTRAGRQMNRRVEVVFAREAGDLVQK